MVTPDDKTVKLEFSNHNDDDEYTRTGGSQHMNRLADPPCRGDDCGGRDARVPGRRSGSFSPDVPFTLKIAPDKPAADNALPIHDQAIVYQLAFGRCDRRHLHALAAPYGSKNCVLD